MKNISKEEAIKQFELKYNCEWHDTDNGDREDIVSASTWEFYLMVRYNEDPTDQNYFDFAGPLPILKDGLDIIEKYYVRK